MSQTKQKRWTKEFIFETLKDNGFHPTDVKFLDGYFIFDHGKDLVEYANEYKYGERQEAQIFLYKFLEKEGIKSHIRAKEDENHCVKTVLEL